MALPRMLVLAGPPKPATVVETATPAPELPEMMLPAPGAVPPMVTRRLVAPLVVTERRMPGPWLPRGEPLASRPMVLPWIVTTLSATSMPAPELPETRLPVTLAVRFERLGKLMP